MSEAETVQEPGRSERARGSLGRVMLAARWIMAPIYLGLLVALMLLVVKFAQKLISTTRELLPMDANETILAVLQLVDLALVANLVVIVMFAGWENFVGPLLTGRGERGHQLFGSLDFSSVKLRLIASVAAVAVIQILETFTHIQDTAKQDALWQLLILLGIGVTGALLAAMDRLSGGH